MSYLRNDEEREASHGMSQNVFHFFLIIVIFRFDETLNEVLKWCRGFHADDGGWNVALARHFLNLT